MDWFFMLGEPLGRDDERQLRAYVERLGLVPAPPRLVKSWAELAEQVHRPGWDERFATAEDRERRRLREIAMAKLGELPLLERLSTAMDATATDVHGAAAVAAARGGCADPGLIRVAAGAAAEAVYLATLAQLAGAEAEHPFALKRALFAAGHWPLGIADGAFLIF